MNTIIGETGVITNFTHESQTIFFDHNYDNPVIFAQPLSYNGPSAAIVRIEDIQSDRFTAHIQETSNLDGKHARESFSYLVVEEGTWQLDNDTLLEVGKVNTNLLTSDGWETVDINDNFAGDPLIFSQVQTKNDGDFVRTRQKNASSNGFQIAMEEEEALNNSGHATETIGWMAIAGGSGSWGQSNYLAGTTGDKVDHNWHTIDFGNNFSRSPVFLSSIASYDGSDPSGLRYRQLSNNQIDVKIEEDTSLNREIKHTTEVVNFFAIDGNNPLLGESLANNSDITTNWDTIYDGLNQSQPLHIKGMENVLIRNSTFKNIKDSDAIIIENSNNVHIESVTVDNLTGKANLDGIKIRDSTNVVIEDSTISRIFSPEHSTGIIITGSESANITINNNHIYNTYGNGILTAGCPSCADKQTVHDMPVPGLKVTNNLIHDTGKTPKPLAGAPTHGMYIQAQDAYIANNQVFNSFDGTGMTIRSTAIVKDNTIWDTKLAGISFLQSRPPGPSMKSVIENNELFFTEDKPEGPGWEPLLFLDWSEESRYPLRYDDFIVRNNKLSICSENVGNSPLFKSYPFDDLTIVGNDFVDHRKQQYFLSYKETPSILQETQNSNSFNQSSCSNSHVSK